MTHTYKYPRPGLVTDVVAFTLIAEKLHVILIKRGIEPYKDKWALPGGYVHDGETVDECASREMSEESGLALPHKCLTEVSVYSQPGRDPRGWIVSVAFYALVPRGTVDENALEAGSDARDARWFPIDALPEGLAFDHYDIIQDAHKCLKNDIFGKLGGERNEVFSFLPEEFTLRELRDVLHSINGEEVFNRSTFVKAAEKNYPIEKAGRLVRHQANKPPNLYRLKKDAHSGS